jgi:hypothetical protein
MISKTNAIPQDGPLRKGARGIDRNDADSFILLSIFRNQTRNQSGFEDRNLKFEKEI